jgi:hypothetical protein
MLTLADIRDILHKIFYNGDPEKLKYVKPLTGSWYLPEIDPEETSATWIGYVILNHDSRNNHPGIQKGIRTTARLTFLGPLAEEFANLTLFWDKNRDVIAIFAEHGAILGDAGVVFAKNWTHDDSQGLAWITDFAVYHS